MKREYYFYLDDMIKAFTLILEFTKGLTYAEFEKDDLRSSAVVRQFEIIGEAAKNIPAEIQDRFPEIPWKQIARTRDRFIHAYFGLDMEILWKLIEEESGDLLKKLKDIRLTIKPGK